MRAIRRFLCDNMARMGLQTTKTRVVKTFDELSQMEIVEKKGTSCMRLIGVRYASGDFLAKSYKTDIAHRPIVRNRSVGVRYASCDFLAKSYNRYRIDSFRLKRLCIFRKWRVVSKKHTTCDFGNVVFRNTFQMGCEFSNWACLCETCFEKTSSLSPQPFV